MRPGWPTMFSFHFGVLRSTPSCGDSVCLCSFNVSLLAQQLTLVPENVPRCTGRATVQSTGLYTQNGIRRASRSDGGEDQEQGPEPAFFQDSPDPEKNPPAGLFTASHGKHSEDSSLSLRDSNCCRASPTSEKSIGFYRSLPGREVSAQGSRSRSSTAAPSSSATCKACEILGILFFRAVGQQQQTVKAVGTSSKQLLWLAAARIPFVCRTKFHAKRKQLSIVVAVAESKPLRPKSKKTKAKPSAVHASEAFSPDSTEASFPAMVDGDPSSRSTAFVWL